MCTLLQQEKNLYFWLFLHDGIKSQILIVNSYFKWINLVFEKVMIDKMFNSLAVPIGGAEHWCPSFTPSINDSNEEHAYLLLVGPVAKTSDCNFGKNPCSYLP